MSTPKPVFVRVKDPDTGHEFDVREGSLLLRKGLVERVKSDRYPPSPVTRTPKHFTDLAGRPASRQSGKAPAKPEPEAAPAVADEATKKGS